MGRQVEAMNRLKLCAFGLVALTSITLVAGHAAMTHPTPRNALDGTLSPWTNWSYPCDARHKGEMCDITFCEDGKNCQGSCAKSAHIPGQEDALTARNGQVTSAPSAILNAPIHLVPPAELLLVQQRLHRRVRCLRWYHQPRRARLSAIPL